MSQSSNNSARRHRRWLPWTLYAVLTLFGLSALVAGSCFLLGRCEGEEFCPATFQRRRFCYFQIPLLRIQVTPIWREDVTNSLESSLLTRKLVRPPEADSIRWDLVYSVRSAAGVTRGDASILCAYLDARNAESDLYWEKWTDEHPKLAKALWPIVARAARQQLYFFTPEIIELARTAEDDAPLQPQLEELLVEQYRLLALSQQKIGAHETALELLEEALSLAPDDPELIQCREESLSQLGASSAP